MKRWLYRYGPTLLLVGLVLGTGLYCGFVNGW